MARTHPKATWAKLRAAYRRGEGSIAELGPKFGIPKSTAEKRCVREKWQVERQEVGQKAATKAVERDVESVAAMLGKHRRLTGRIVELVAERLEGDKKLSTNALDQLSLVLARTVPVERLAAGIERVKPVKPVELDGDDEVVFEVDAPPEDEDEPPRAAAGTTS